MEHKLSILKNIPDSFLTVDYHDIKQILKGPTLIHLQGEKEPALFISIMLHGNEYSGLQIMQEVRITSYNVCYTKLLRTDSSQFLKERFCCRYKTHVPCNRFDDDTGDLTVCFV